MDVEPPRELEYDDVDEERLNFYSAQSFFSQYPDMTVSGLWDTLVLVVKELDSEWRGLFVRSKDGKCPGDKHIVLKGELEACIKDKDKDISDICRLGWAASHISEFNVTLY